MPAPLFGILIQLPNSPVPAFCRYSHREMPASWGSSHDSVTFPLAGSALKFPGLAGSPPESDSNAVTSGIEMS